MELRQIRYFTEVAKTKHFTRAAEAIGIAQPALSQQIRVLERELGVALLERTSRRVTLTPAGQVFLERAEQLLADAAQAQLEMQEFAGLARGKVAVGTIPSLDERWLADLLSRFVHQYPGIELVLQEEITGQLTELVAVGQLDLAFVHLPGTQSSIEGGAPPRLATAPLFTEDVVIAVGPEHRLAAASHVSLGDLRDERWVLLKPGSVTRQTVIDACAALGFAPRIAFESSSLTPVRALASANLGIAVLPRSVAETEGPKVAILTLEHPHLSRTVGLVWRATATHSRAAAAFLTFARTSAPSTPSPSGRELG